MKKMIVLTIILLFAVNCSGKYKNPENLKQDINSTMPGQEVTVRGVAKLLPDNAVLMFKLNSIKNIHKYLSITDKTIFGEPIDDVKKLTKDLGFNPFNIKALQSKGIDVNKEIGFIFTEITIDKNIDNDNHSISGLFFIPVTDGQKALKTITGLWKKNSLKKVKITTEGKLTVIHTDARVDKIYLVLRDHFLFIAISSKNNTKSLIESIGKTSLALSKAYRDVSSKIDSSKEIFFYANIKEIAKNNLSAIINFLKQNPLDMSKMVDMLKDYETFGLSINLESSDLIVNTIFNLDSNSKILNLIKNVKYDKNIILGLKENPVLLISYGIDAPEYYKTILDTLSKSDALELKSAVKGFKTNFGIDVQKDVINNLAGNFNIGVYDGGSINMMNYNTILTVNVRNESKVKSVIKKVISKLPPMQKQMIRKEKIGSVDAHVITVGGIFQLYAGLKNKNLILALGKPMFEKAINGNTSTGFISKLKDRKLIKTLKNDSEAFLYLNVNEVFNAVKNFSMLFMEEGKGIDQKTTNAINQFKYLLISSQFEKNSITGDLIIKTQFKKPFLVGVKELKDSFNK